MTLPRWIPMPVVWGALGLFAFVAGIYLFDFVILPRLVHQGQDARVPDVALMTLAQARAAAERAGLKLKVRTEQFDSSAPRGTILNQDPPPGVLARRGRDFEVVVSLGEEKASMPPLAGREFREAQLTLGRLNLAPGYIARTPSDVVPFNQVIASDPSADDPIPQDRPVHLLMSQGPRERRWVLPDYVGTSGPDAVARLMEGGVKAVLSARATPNSVVTWMRPAAGSMVKAGEEVSLGLGVIK